MCFPFFVCFFRVLALVDARHFGKEARCKQQTRQSPRHSRLSSSKHGGRKKKEGGGGLVGKKNEVTECGRGQKCGDYLTALPFLRLLAQLLSIKAPKKSSRHLIYDFIYSLISSGMPSTTTRVEIAAHRRWWNPDCQHISCCFGFVGGKKMGLLTSTSFFLGGHFKWSTETNRDKW